MRGTALIYSPGIDQPEVHQFRIPPSLEFLQKAVGGHIEAIPGFARIKYGGETRACAAFCNEEGKLEGLSPNYRATALWHAVLPAPGLLGRDSKLLDILCGPVIVLFGDAEFMESL
jgi:hypothetical protein